MKKQTIAMVAGLAVVVAAVSLYIAWDPFGPARRKWTEDVDLGDGRVIQVERSVAFNETNSWSGDAYNAVETEATIKFTGELAKLPTWSQPLMALVMYQDKATNEWTVVATTTSSDVLQQRGNPCPGYWEFRLSANGWRDTPLSAASIGRAANLLHRYQSELKTKHITIEERKRLEIPGRPFNAMSPIEKSYRVILSKSEAHCLR